MFVFFPFSLDHTAFRPIGFLAFGMEFANRLWPTYASAHNNLGTLVNNLDVAENHFLSAIMYASTHVNAHYNLGQLYLK